MAFRVVIDACVLINYPITDLLLRLAEAELYEPVWSPDILDEVERNLVAKRRLPAAKAKRRIEAMRTAFPLAETTGYRDLIPVMRNDAKDRHVLAAAVHAHAALIVTANRKDFPPEALQPFGVEAIGPDDFLLDQLDLDPSTTLPCLDLQHRALKRPAMTRVEFYGSLRVGAPNFADAAEQLHSDFGDRQATLGPALVDLPPPIVEATPEALQQAFLPAGKNDGLAPEGVIFYWFTALMNLDSPDAEKTLTKLSYNPELLPDYRAVADLIRHRSLTQERHPDTLQPDHICYFKLAGIDIAGQVFAPFPADAWFVMLVRDGIFDPWRVLAVGPTPWDENDQAGGPAANGIRITPPSS